jgi:protein SCO1/2
VIEHRLRIPVRRSVRPAVAAGVVAAALVLGIGGGVLLRALHHGATATSSRPSLPSFHGQAVWAAGERPAPNFRLHDQDGAPFALSSLRGRPVLLTFLDSQCHQECPIEGRQLSMILRALPPAGRPALVVVSVDRTGDTPAGIAQALKKWHLAGPWTTRWLNAPTHDQLAAVWREYGITVEPVSNDVVHSLALYLIDRAGYERTAYLFPFLPAFVQRDLVHLAGARA